MNTVETINQILGITESYKAPDRIMEILMDKPVREEVFLKLLESFKYKLNEDWFHDYFQAEHAERRVHKQDFTPMTVSNLINTMVNEDGMYFECCAGTGGMCISHWHLTRVKYHPLLYKPSNHLHVLEELSDRAIPFLLLNVAIRGMNAAVIHCDSLSRDCYGAFLIQNDKDDPLAFSSVNVMPYSDAASKYFNARFVGEKYPAYVESPNPFLGVA